MGRTFSNSAKTTKKLVEALVTDKQFSEETAHEIVKRLPESVKEQVLGECQVIKKFIGKVATPSNGHATTAPIQLRPKTEILAPPPKPTAVSVGEFPAGLLTPGNRKGNYKRGFAFTIGDFEKYMTGECYRFPKDEFFPNMRHTSLMNALRKSAIEFGLDGICRSVKEDGQQVVYFQATLQEPTNDNPEINGEDGEGDEDDENTEE